MTSSKINKKPEWDYYTHIWKTEAAYLSWIRGQIRRMWNHCPQKIEFLKKNSQQLPKLDENGDEIIELLKSNFFRTAGMELQKFRKETIARRASIEIYGKTNIIQPSEVKL